MALAQDKVKTLGPQCSMQPNDGNALPCWLTTDGRGTEAAAKDYPQKNAARPSRNRVARLARLNAEDAKVFAKDAKKFAFASLCLTFASSA